MIRDIVVFETNQFNEGAPAPKLDFRLLRGALPGGVSPLAIADRHGFYVSEGQHFSADEVSAFAEKQSGYRAYRRPMEHKDYGNGYIAHNIEDRLNLPCGSVAVFSDGEQVFALAEFDGPNQGQTEVEVVKSDLSDRVGAVYCSLTAMYIFLMVSRRARPGGMSDDHISAPSGANSGMADLR